MKTKYKVIIIASTLLVSAAVGTALWFYYQRKSILDQLVEGQPVLYSTKEPKSPKHSGNEYSLKLVRDANSADKVAIWLYQDNELKGQYWMIDDMPYYVTKEEKVKQPIENKSEARFVKYILKNA